MTVIFKSPKTASHSPHVSFVVTMIDSRWERPAYWVEEELVTMRSMSAQGDTTHVCSTEGEQAINFNLTIDVRGEARIVERVFDSVPTLPEVA